MIKHTSGRVLISNYLIGIIIFTFLVVAGISMLDVLKDDSPSMINSSKYSQFNSSFNKIEDVNSGVAGLKSGITDAKPDLGVFGVLNALISSAWTSLKLLFTSFGFVGTMLTGLTTIFGVPAWIIGLGVSVITIIIVFAIYAAIFQTDN